MPPGPDTRAPAVRIGGLRHGAGGRTVLELADWRVEHGGRSLVLGPSGSGKTTLLHLIAGLATPTEGGIRIFGEEPGRMRQAARDRFRGRNIGIVFQTLHLIGALRVADNLRLARAMAGLPPDPDRIADALERVGMAAFSRAWPAQLSHGEAQRAAVARALVTQPRLVLADEPTSALDDENCAAVARLLIATAEESGASLIVASHDRRLADLFADRLMLERRK